MASTPINKRRMLTSAGGLRSAAALVLGIALLVLLVRQVDAAELWRTLLGSRGWLPLLAALEGVLLFTDTAAFAELVAPARPIPARGWWRSSAGFYLCMVLLPAGRAVGEATRALIVSPYAGAKRAALASTELQAVALIADGAVALASALAVSATIGTAQHLATSLLASSALVTFLGAALLYLTRKPRLAQRILLRFPRLERLLPKGSSGPTGSAWRATLWSVAGRFVQVLQYGTAISAAGGVFGFTSAFIAHGIHTVGAIVGFAMPNHLGVADGAYLIFAGALGFARDPARALAAVLLVRCAQLLLAVACGSIVVLLRERSPTPSPA